VYEQFHPDRILIEPSGVGKLSDVIAAVEDAVAVTPELKLNSHSTVVDATKVKLYMKNFPEFYNNQVESAGSIVLSRTQKLSQDKLEAAVQLLRSKNATAAILTTPWDELDGKTILAAMEGGSLSDRLLELVEEAHEHHHHHEHEHDEDEHDHEHHHHDHDHDEHHHHNHDHDEHHHDHDHDHDEHCSCGHDHHHHHHDADEAFDSWGRETPKPFTHGDLDHILEELDTGAYGQVLRAKGIVPGAEGGWLEFDYVPGEWQVRDCGPDYTGRLCVIGAQLNEDGLAALFGL
jgi:G3E family GTPase